MCIENCLCFVSIFPSHLYYACNWCVGFWHIYMIPFIINNAFLYISIVFLLKILLSYNFIAIFSYKFSLFDVGSPLRNWKIEIFPLSNVSSWGLFCFSKIITKFSVDGLLDFPLVCLLVGGLHVFCEMFDQLVCRFYVQFG